ncbi:MAG: hypothetical protein JNK56_17950 [Myxococcales bacterium]|nr:hypothetical protein [Myxococcales bacterium]
MMLSLRNTLRAVSLLVATIAFAPGCDDGQLEALGLSAEELDNMSEQELDELAEIDDLTAPVRPGEPDPAHRPTDLREPAADAHQTPGISDELRNPIRFTHVDGVDDELRNPIRFTHTHKRPSAVPGLVNPVRPTHSPADHAVHGLANEVDEGCDTHGDDPDLSNG